MAGGDHRCGANAQRETNRMRATAACILAAALTAHTQTSVTVDWASTRYAISPFAFGLNGFRATNPAETGNTAYANNMKYMLATPRGSAMVRIHTWEMMAGGANGWITNGTWDAAKVKSSVGNLVRDGFTVCINIPDGVSAQNKVSNPQGFASFCADLVRIVNVDGGLGVSWWEVPNERDGSLGGTALANVFNTACRAMKAVDPSIKVGGPAYQYPHKTADINAFVDLTVSNLDFLSFHCYAGGGGMSDEAVWDAAGAEGYCRAMSSYLQQKSPGRHIPLWYDEFNVGWSWDLAQSQQNGICGAIYDALTCCDALDAGADVLCAWNEKDGSYGKMDGGNALRPAAHVFHMFNSYAYGSRVTTTSTASASVVPFASTGGADGRRTVILINRTKSPQSVRLTFGSWTSTTAFECYQLTPSGYVRGSSATVAQLQSGVSLPAQSVTTYTIVSATGFSMPVLPPAHRGAHTALSVVPVTTHSAPDFAVLPLNCLGRTVSLDGTSRLSSGVFIGTLPATDSRQTQSRHAR